MPPTDSAVMTRAVNKVLAADGVAALEDHRQLRRVDDRIELVQPTIVASDTGQRVALRRCIRWQRQDEAFGSLDNVLHTLEALNVRRIEAPIGDRRAVGSDELEQDRWRDLRALVRQNGEFATHSWRYKPSTRRPDRAASRQSRCARATAPANSGPRPRWPRSPWACSRPSRRIAACACTATGSPATSRCSLRAAPPANTSGSPDLLT